MLRRLIGIWVLGVVVLAMVQVVGANPDSQTWYFTNTEASVPIYAGSPTVDYQRVMTKGVKGGDTVITLAPGERVWFYADQLTQCNVGFPAGVWDTVCWVKALDSGDLGKRVYIRLQGIDSEGNKISGSHGYAEGWSTIKTLGGLEEISKALNPESFTIPEGGRFAVEVLWSGEVGELEIHFNPSGDPVSKTTSPSSDPGYPVPELPTVILFSTGLIALTGYILLTKRRK